MQLEGLARVIIGVTGLQLHRGLDGLVQLGKGRQDLLQPATLANDLQRRSLVIGWQGGQGALDGGVGLAVFLLQQCQVKDQAVDRLLALGRQSVVTLRLQLVHQRQGLSKSQAHAGHEFLVTQHDGAQRADRLVAHDPGGLDGQVVMIRDLLRLLLVLRDDSCGLSSG